MELLLIIGLIVIVAIFSFISGLIQRYKSNKRKRVIMNKYKHSPISKFDTEREDASITELTENIGHNKSSQFLWEKEVYRRKFYERSKNINLPS